MGLSTEEFFVAGQPLDAVIYNGDSPLLNVAGLENLLSTLVYTADGSSVAGTIVDGDWIVKNQFHRNGEEILKDFQRALKGLARI